MSSFIDWCDVDHETWFGHEHAFPHLAGSYNSNLTTSNNVQEGMDVDDYVQESNDDNNFFFGPMQALNDNQEYYYYYYYSPIPATSVSYNLNHMIMTNDAVEEGMDLIDYVQEGNDDDDNFFSDPMQALNDNQEYYYYYYYSPTPGTSVSYNMNHMMTNDDVQEGMDLIDYARENNYDDEGFFDFELQAYWNQEHDETMIFMSPASDGLSEDVISRYLKSRNISDEVRATDEDGDPKICTVCEYDLCQLEDDDQMIATLHCGHEYHSCCIKQWLQQKNICPLCKGIALPVGR